VKAKRVAAERADSVYFIHGKLPGRSTLGHPIVPPDRSTFLVALGGLVAGALDISYAFVFYGSMGVSPLRILQSIASGLLGRASYQGGIATAALGLTLHFLIAVAAAFVFYAASRRIGWMVRHWLVSGAVFGLGMHGFMNFVVLPLSAYPHKLSFPWPALLSGLFVHAFLVGVPIAFGVHRASMVRPVERVPG
jgi:hypothetical protein